MLFYGNYKPHQNIFNEIEVDGQPIEDNQEPPADYTDAGEGNPPEGGMDQPPAEPQTGGEPQDPNTDNPNEEPPVDYTDAGAGALEGEEPPSDGGGAPPPAENQPSEIDDIKKQEEELYNELSPEQLDIKHKELKTQFLSMYDIIVSLIDKLGSVSTAEEDIVVVEYVSNELSKLKDMITDYVNDVYKTKSYIENSINYNRFLAVLHGINKVLEEMNSKNDEN